MFSLELRRTCHTSWLVQGSDIICYGESVIGGDEVEKVWKKPVVAETT